MRRLHWLGLPLRDCRVGDLDGAPFAFQKNRPKTASPPKKSPKFHTHTHARARARMKSRLKFHTVDSLVAHDKLLCPFCQTSKFVRGNVGSHHGKTGDYWRTVSCGACEKLFNAMMLPDSVDLQEAQPVLTKAKDVPRGMRPVAYRKKQVGAKTGGAKRDRAKRGGATTTGAKRLQLLAATAREPPVAPPPVAPLQVAPLQVPPLQVPPLQVPPLQVPPLQPALQVQPPPPSQWSQCPLGVLVTQLQLLNANMQLLHAQQR